MLLERIAEIFWLGLKNLMRNKLRSFLTMLGMIFGVGSVIAMLSVGAGARNEILARIGELGVQNIILNSVKPPEEVEAEADTQYVNTYGLRFEDAERIRETCSTARRVLPVNKVHERVWYGSRRVDASVHGVSPQHVRMFRLDVDRGRPITDLDEERQNKVCLIRANLLRKLQTVEDPLDLVLSIGGFPFRVVGVLEDEAFRSHTRKALAIGEGVQEVYIPYATSMRTFGTVNYVRRTGSTDYSKVELDQIVVETTSPDEVFATARMISRILEEGHDKEDYEVVVPLELLQQQEKTQQVFSIVMVAIACISLLVGGIGIVNIMLATITERTKEIGIRRAMGARRRDVTAQFLTETVAIAAIGGLLGCVFSIGGVKALVHFAQWNAVIAPHYVLVALGISCSVGVLFGIYPARRAARMDPITALRWE